jgi:hypothetical protein
MRALPGMAVLLLGACGQQSAVAPPVDNAVLQAQRAQLAGLWVRTDDVGSGNFGAMFASIKRPELLPAAQAIVTRHQMEKVEEERVLTQKSGGVYKVLPSCNPPGIIFMMQHSGAFDIVLQQDEVLIVPEHPGTQTIYLDGRPHPSLDHWTPLGNGHSVGHWEGAELVVSTIGMRDDGDSVPGGGVFQPSTELVERFTLRDSQHLSIGYTWSDPQLYARPHSYTLTYAKQAADSYAFESWCDVTDPLQAQSVVIPPQSKAVR